MTKRWLSILLVLMLVLPIFGTTAFAAGGAITFKATSQTVSLTPGQVVTGQVIGQIYVNSSPITQDDFIALNGKITASCTAADGAIACSLDTSGNVSVTFTAVKEAVKDAAVELAIDNGSYTGTIIATGIKATVSVPVTSIRVAQAKTNKFVDLAGGVTIEAKTASGQTAADEPYYLFAGARPTTALESDLVVSAKSSDKAIVTVEDTSAYDSELTSWTQTNAALTKAVVLTGIKPGTATITFTAGGVSVNVPVTVKTTAMTAYDVEYKNPAGTLAGSSVEGASITNGLAVGLTAEPSFVDASVQPAHATEKKLSYTIATQDPDGIALGDVISIDATTGKVTALQAGTAEILVNPVDNTGKAGSRVVKFKVVARDASAVAQPVISVVADAADESGADGSSSNPFTVARKFEIKTVTANSSIYYTLDGTEPTKSSTLYSAPIELEATPKDKSGTACGIRAKAFYNGTDVALTASTEATRAAADLTFDLKVTKVTLPATLAVSGTTQTTLATTLAPADLTKISTANKTVTWTSSDDSIINDQALTTSDDGRTIQFKALKAGKVTLTATVEYGASASCEVTVADAKVTAISLDKKTADLPANEQLTLVPTVTPAGAFDADTLVWTTSDAKVAVVNNGVVTVPAGVTSGTASITVWNSDKTVSGDTCIVTVKGKSNVVAAPVFTVKDGGTVLSGTSFDKKGYTVTATSATSGASIAMTGTLNGVAISTVNNPYTLAENGTYVLTATATDGEGVMAPSSATATYVVSVPVTKVTIGATGTFDATKKTLGFTGAYDGSSNKSDLSVTLVPGSGADVGDPAVKWTTSNDKVVAVYDKETKVDGVTYAASTAYPMGEGTATITATTTGNAKPVTDTITVTVKKQLVTGITNITPDALNAGETVKLSATVAPANASNKTLSWQITSQTPDNTADTTVATIDAATGKITGVAKGTCTVVATSTDGSLINSLAQTITVGAATAQVATPTVKIDGSAYTSTQTATITAEGKATLETITNGAAIYYTTNGTTPSAKNGTRYNAEFVLPAEAASLKVVAVKDGMTDSAVVTVGLTWDIKPTAITLTPSKATVEQGEKFTITAAFTPANTADTYKAITTSSLSGATNFTVSEADSKTGVFTLTAKADAPIGKNTISLASQGVTGKCDVTIAKKSVSGVEIVAANEGTMAVGSTNQLTAVVTPASADQTVTWNSATKTVATISADGLVTAVAPGTSVITAISVADSTKTATYTVTVGDPTTPPKPLTVRPTLTSITKTIEVLEDASKKVAIAKFAEADVAAIKYYFTPTFAMGDLSSNSGATFTGSATISMDDTGTVYMNVKNASAAGTYTFNYTWALTPIAGRGGEDWSAPLTVSGNALNVVAAPTVISFSPETVAAIEMTDAETKTVTVGKILNYADFIKSNVVVSATVSTGSVAIGTDGTVTVTLDKPEAGEYNVVVTLSAKKCADVKTSGFKVTVTKAPITEYKILVDGTTLNTESAGTIYVPFVKKGTFQLKLNEGTATGWKIAKAGKKKTIATIDANGLVTMKKKAGTFTVTAVNEKGETVTQIFSTKIAKSLKLQRRNPKDTKWVAVKAKAGFSVQTGTTLKVRALVNKPSKAPVFNLAWTSSDETIFTVAGSTTDNTAIITPVALGTATLTATCFNNVVISCPVNVIATAVAEEEAPEVEVKVGKISISRK